MSAILSSNYAFFIIIAYVIFTVTLSGITLYSMIKLHNIKRKLKHVS